METEQWGIWNDDPDTWGWCGTGYEKPYLFDNPEDASIFMLHVFGTGGRDRVYSIRPYARIPDRICKTCEQPYKWWSNHLPPNSCLYALRMRVNELEAQLGARQKS